MVVSARIVNPDPLSGFITVVLDGERHSINAGNGMFSKALEAYKGFMQYGYTLTIPELYEKAGIKFDFSPEYIGELMDFVEVQLQKTKFQILIAREFE